MLTDDQERITLYAFSPTTAEAPGSLHSLNYRFTLFKRATYLPTYIYN